MNPGTQVTRLPEPLTFRRIPGQVWCRPDYGFKYSDVIILNETNAGTLILCERYEASSRTGLVVEYRPVSHSELPSATSR